jgi:hypothetical protein
MLPLSRSKEKRRTPPTPPGRERLYRWSQQFLHSTEGIRGENAARQLIQETAHQMVLWLLQVPLEHSDHHQGTGRVLQFQAAPGEQAASSLCTIGNVLDVYPWFLQRQCGNQLSKVVVYAPRHQLLQVNHARSADRRHNCPLLERTLQHFPILYELVRQVQLGCQCDICKPSGSSGQELFRAGCFGHTCCQEVLYLVGNAVANGFGSQNRAPSVSINNVVEATAHLLLQLCEEKKVTWNTWFSTAACVELGCPFIANHPVCITGKTCVGIQYYGTSLLANWADSGTWPKVQSCFRASRRSNAQVRWTLLKYRMKTRARLKSTPLKDMVILSPRETIPS